MTPGAGPESRSRAPFDTEREGWVTRRTGPESWLTTIADMDALNEEWSATATWTVPPGSDRAGWDRAAAAVLVKAHRMTAGDDPSEARNRLSRTTSDGIRVLALGTRADREAQPPTGHPGSAPFTRGSTPATGQGWDIRVPISDPDPDRAATTALADLEGGASSLLLTVGDRGTRAEDIARVLDGVHLDFAPVVLRPERDAEPGARELLATLADRRLIPAAGTHLGFDPIGQLARFPEEAVEVTGQVALASDIAGRGGVGAIMVDSTVVHDAGGTPAQELGYALAAGVTYLRLLTAAGVPTPKAVRLLEFRYAVSDDQFGGIALLRAARMLWHRVTELSGLAPVHRSQRQHAITSAAMMTRYDPWVNMLRTTVAALAAGAGGADSLTVRPFDECLGVSDDLGRRIARNTSSLLIGESHLAKVADPAGGAYAVESLTGDLARAGWSVFTEIERTGGILTALADDSFPSTVRTAAAHRNREIAHREHPLTGLSEFPLAGESLLRRPALPEPAVSTDPRALTPRRWGQDFEDLRDHPTPLPVLLITVGPVAGHTARLGFSTNLLVAGGISIESADSDAAVQTLRRLGTPVVMLAGADDDVATEGPELIASLRTAGARHLVLAGRPPGSVADLVDDHVTARSDAIAFLTRTRRHLGSRV